MTNNQWWSGGHIRSLCKEGVFVFGSNPEGRHGAGAAAAALNFGAEYGVGRGLVGQTYALPTKNLTEGFVEQLDNGRELQYEKAGMRSISPIMIMSNIRDMYLCAAENPDRKFYVAYLNDGNNLNGYTSEEMWRLFMAAEVVPPNVYFHESFALDNIDSAHDPELGRPHRKSFKFVGNYHKTPEKPNE